MTYGDGVSDVDVAALLAFHRSPRPAGDGDGGAPDLPVRQSCRSPTMPTCSASPKSRSSTAGSTPASSSSTAGSSTTSDGDDCILEQQPLERLAAEEQLMAYRHDGFFYAMDTYREYAVPERALVQRQGPVEGRGNERRFWQDRPTLVTGATGLVGSWLVKPLAARRGPTWSAWCATGCRRANWCAAGRVEQVKVVRGDVRDQALLERALGEYEIDTVFHLAAQTIVGIANRNPVSTFETNIQGHLGPARSLPAGRRWSKQIVIASSRQGLRRPGKAALRRDDPARGPASVRRQQVVRGPDRAGVCRDLRPAGGHHALRQFLRRRRPELEPHRARHDPLGPPRPAAR